jgi:Leucine-rich repeat (LRR) protein
MRLTFGESDVSENEITSIPDRFASLGNLTHFTAASCNLTGSIPQSLLSSSSIINIDLSANQLTGSVQLASSSLYTLVLKGNQLSSIDIQNTVGTTGLGRVDIGSNAFTGNLPDLSGSANLSSFDASFNK